jgi:hypothetical protein
VQSSEQRLHGVRGRGDAGKQLKAGGGVGRVGQKAEHADGVAGPSWASKANWAERPDRPTGLLG